MKKNFRKIPDYITNRINEFDSDNFIVATTLKVSKNDLNNPKFSNLDLQIDNGVLLFNKEFVPNKNNGTFSKRNIEGYKIVYRDREKIRKRFYLGERPIWGDWSKGSFSLYISRLVYPYKRIPPQDLSIQTELIDENENYYYLKVRVNTIINRTNDSYEDELFFAINLLQENIYSINVFPSDADRATFMRTLSLTWEIFPPGERDSDLERIIRATNNPNVDTIKRIQKRYDFLMKMNPIEIITGISGMRKYFGAKFSERLVVFENMNYGNAIYILFENWEELSHLSRTEILNRQEDQYIRIRHSRNWEVKLKRIIANRK